MDMKETMKVVDDMAEVIVESISKGGFEDDQGRLAVPIIIGALGRVMQYLFDNYPDSQDVLMVMLANMMNYFAEETLDEGEIITHEPIH